ncbi:EAL domain-containing protein [Legionella sainthelensi]|uniref:EAL domain-containing protein n=1 Tax=Legionella sainthelensi TaxID=28087 RepID=UPI000E203898|nr:EAL domain-containing protein [Legionella sainthelensi]
MRRLKIIVIAIGFAVIGAILPMTGSIFFSWQLALQRESHILFEYSTRMLERARYTVNQARQILTSLENHKGNLLPCSPEHINWMQNEQASVMEVQSIAYFKNGYESCTGCSNINPQTARSKTDFILPDGLEIASTYHAKIPLIALRKNTNYDIFIDPKRLSDIIVPEEIWLAIIYNGKLLTQHHKIKSSVLREIMSTINTNKLSKYYEKHAEKERLKPATDLKRDKVLIIAKQLVSINQYGPFYFIAVEPEYFIYDSYKKLLFILLPFGLVTAAFIAGLVIYFSNKRLSFKAELKAALNNNELCVHYQPIVHTALETCFGAEALVRWQRPSGQMVRPDLFIPYAEENGMISSITNRVIDMVFDDMGELLKCNKQLHISINVAYEDIQTGQLFTLLESKIKQTKIQRNQIWIELIERTCMKAEKVTSMIAHARELGYVVVIDDFGTGFSNLSYLRTLPLDVLKIDKEFIDSLGMHAVTSNVTDHIIKIAKSLNLQLVAEGVETQAQFDYLKEKNVDYIQGYFFSKPLPVKEFIQFLYQLNKEPLKINS